MYYVKGRTPVLCLLFLLCCINCAAALTSAETWARAERDFGDRRFADALASYLDYKAAIPTCSSGETACKLDRAKALLKLGECNYHLGRFSEGRGYLDILLNSYASVDSTVVAEAQYHMGACLKEEGSLVQAIAAFDKTVADFPGDKGYPSRATLAKAQVQSSLGDWEASIRTYLGALTTYSDKPDVCRQAKEGITQTVMASGKAGGYATTIAALDKALTDYAADAELCANLGFWKGKFQHESHKYCPEAITTFRDLIARHPQSREYNEACVRLGEDLILASKRSEAAAHLTPLLTDTKLSHAEIGRMTLFMGMCQGDNWSKAEEWYTKVINDFGDTKFDREAYYKRAIVRTNQAAYEKAMEDINMIKQPACWVHFARGYYHFRQSNWSTAAESFAQVLPSLPEPMDLMTDVPLQALFDLAECYDKMGDTGRAASARAQWAESRAKWLKTDTGGEL